jgi:uncharacterized repeat protein (TIGR02543 family)
VTIDGGSVNAGSVIPAPLNLSGKRVYLNEATFSRDLAGQAVEGGATDEAPCYIDERGGEGSYGIKDMLVGADNSLWLYLPAGKGGAAGLSFTVGGQLYGENAEHIKEATWLLSPIPDVEVPGPLDAVYLQTLSEVALPEGWAFTEDGDTEVGKVGARWHPALFTPEDEEYSTVAKSVLINVARKDPEASPQRTLSAVYGQTLGDLDLSYRWAWDEDGSTPVGDAGDRQHPATYTHPDAEGYNTQCQDVEVTVAKAVPDVQKPSAISTLEGATLGELALPDGWSFDEPPATQVGSSGARQWAVTYTPDDPANWEALHANVLVVVNEGEAVVPPAAKVKTVKIRFKGASGVKAVTATVGKKIGKLPTPTKKGYKFTGWHTKKNGGAKVSASYIVTAKTPAALYAHWQKRLVYGKVTGCKSLFVRVHPSPHSNRASVSGYLRQGAKVCILAKTGDWYKVSAGKQKGYVYARYIKKIKA